jgi:hypothetical protein
MEPNLSEAQEPEIEEDFEKMAEGRLFSPIYNSFRQH